MRPRLSRLFRQCRLKAHSVPGAKKSDSKLKADEVEIGMGIHNEPGHSNTQLTTSSRLLSELLSLLTSTSDEDRSYVPFKGDGSDHVVLLVNNLGALPELELSIVVRDAAKWLGENRFTVVRVLAGTFMTSFAMPGCSISVLRLPVRGEDKVDQADVLESLDAPADAPGWKWSYNGEPAKEVLKESEEEESESAAAAAGATESEARGPGRALARPLLCGEIKLAQQAHSGR